MATEAAMCLINEQTDLPPTFGAITPSVAFGKVLRDRLIVKGIDFVVNGQT